MKYIIYARKSTESEDRQIQSIDDQVNYLTSLAKDRDLEIVKVFTESKSAKKPGRPVFNEAMQFIQSGKADAILAWKIDRLCRNPIDAGNIQWMLQEAAIKEIVTSEKTYLPNDNAILFAVESSSANQYVRDLSTNIKRGIRSKLEKGVWPIVAPIGYLNKDKMIVVDKKRAKYIRRAFELYAGGDMSLKAVANQLYKEGFRTPNGNKYHKSNIQGMLNRTFYYGVMEMNGEFFPGNHEPIITKKLFDKAQDILHGKKHPKRQTHFFPYRGMFTCEKCGCMLTATKKKGYTYYYCTNGKGVCDQHRKYIREEVLEKRISKALKRLTFEEKYVDIMYKASLERLESDDSYKESVVDSLTKQLTVVATKRDRLLEGYCSNIVSKDVYTQKESVYNKEEAEIKNKLNKIENKRLKSRSTLEQQKIIFLTACTLQKTFLESKKSQKRKTLQKALWNATVEDKEIAQLSLKPTFQMLLEVEDLSDFEQLRRGRDSNPRGP